MAEYRDPKTLNFNGGEYAQSTDANGNVHIHNREGRETWQSVYDNNVRETNENNASKQKEYELQKEEEERKRRATQQQHTSSGGSAGPALGGFFLGTAGLALPFVFNGLLVLILAVLGKILSPVMPLIELLWELFWMFLTCWLRVFKIWFTGPHFDTFFRNLRSRWVFLAELVIAAIFLISTLIKSFNRDDYWYEDNRNLKPLIIFPVLELIHSFTTVGTYFTYGHLKSIPNGLFLGAQLLIVMGWIIRLINRMKYR